MLSKKIDPSKYNPSIGRTFMCFHLTDRVFRQFAIIIIQAPINEPLVSNKDTGSCSSSTNRLWCKLNY